MFRFAFCLDDNGFFASELMSLFLHFFDVNIIIFFITESVMVFFLQPRIILKFLKLCVNDKAIIVLTKNWITRESFHPLHWTLLFFGIIYKTFFTLAEAIIIIVFIFLPVFLALILQHPKRSISFWVVQTVFFYTFAVSWAV